MSQSTANCAKCGIKHSRPVGVRCKRFLNVSAPVTESHSSMDSDSFIAPNQLAGQQQESGSTSASSKQSLAGTNPGAATQVEAKLDLILKRMDQLENKNHELEQQVAVKKKTKNHHISHSSPKRSHTCSRICSSHRSSKSQAVRKDVSDAQDSSDDDVTTDTSYSRISHSGHDSQVSDQVSMDFLKTDERVQRKVQRQLERLQGKQRHSAGNKTIKSGLHRAGDSAVKQEISWPHHHCFAGPGGQLPDYKELSPLQFMVGFLGCLQEENSSTIKTNMIEYGRHLFQDAIETNWATAKHAHMVLLQDIERGKCTWRNTDKIEKIRIRNTARVINTKQPPSQTKSSKSSNHEKVCQDYNANNCQQSADHIQNGQILKHACSYCFQEAGKFCQHKVQDCIRRRNNEQKNSKNSS